MKWKLFKIPLGLSCNILLVIMPSVRQNVYYSLRFVRGALCRALLVAVVALFWIYSSVVPQIGLSKPCLLALKKTYKPDQMLPLIPCN